MISPKMKDVDENIMIFLAKVKKWVKLIKKLIKNHTLDFCMEINT